jgi:hypothetical protein
MKTIQKLPVKEGRLLLLNRIFSHPILTWTPQADEKRFLVGLPITLVLILILWKQGIGGSLGWYPFPVSYVLWFAAYAIRFRQRLKDRGELESVIIAMAVFVTLLLGFDFYARW